MANARFRLQWSLDPSYRMQYGSLLVDLEWTGENQISLTDPDTRAMAGPAVSVSVTLRRRRFHTVRKNFALRPTPAFDLSEPPQFKWHESRL
jgi:hypothetical protein